MSVQGPHRSNGVLPAPASPETGRVAGVTGHQAPQGAREVDAPPPNLVNTQDTGTALSGLSGTAAQVRAGPALEDPRLRDFERQNHRLTAQIGYLERSLGSDRRVPDQLRTLRTQLDGVRAAAMESLRPRIEIARRQLQSWKVPEHFSEATYPETLVRLVPVLEAWSKLHEIPPHRVPTKDLGLLFNIAESSRSRDIQHMLAGLENVPRSFVDDPMYLAQVGADFGRNGVKRAEQLAEDFGYRPTPGDAEVLGNLSGGDYRRLKRRWGELAKRAGFAPTRSVPPVTQLLLIDEPMGLGTLNEDALYRGAEALHETTGLPLSGPDIYAATILGQGNPRQRAALESLLARWEPSSGGSLPLAFAAMQGPPPTAAQLEAVDTAVERLGGRLDSGEMLNLLDALRHGASLDTLVPSEIRAVSTNHPVPLKDVSVWRGRGFQPLSADARAALRQGLAKDIIPGTVRADIALPSESLADAELSDGELLKLRHIVDALQKPEFAVAIGAHIQRDLADLTAEGLATLPLGSQGVTWNPVESAAVGNGHVALPPRPQLEPLHVVALAHLHATEAGGNASHAGPSMPDLAYAQSGHQDWIVVTHLGQDRFNVDFYTASGSVVDLGDYPPREVELQENH